MRRLIPALLAYILLIAWPVLPDLRRLAIGHPAADVWNHVWGYGHVAAALAAGRSPLDTPLVNHPIGGRLWFIDMFGAVLLSPVTLTGGAVLAYNLYLLLSVLWAGIAAYLLARELRVTEAGAWLAGVAFAATPHLLGQLHNGISETLAVGFVPFFLRSLLRWRAEPDLRRSVWVGVSFTLSVWANPYYGLFNSFAGLVMVLGQVRRWPSLLPGAAVAIIGVLPVALLFSGTLDASGAVVDRDPDFVYRTLVGHNMTDFLAFFHPGPRQFPDLKLLFDEDLLVVVYLGFALLGAAWWGSRDDRARPWVVGGLAAFVLTLGPFLYIGGSYVRLGEAWVPLPFLGLYDLVPALSRISHPYRFVVLVALCLAVLAALGVRRWRVAAPLGLLIVLETLVISPVKLPLAVSDATVPLAYADLPADRAVLDLPVSVPVLARARYNLYQLRHGAPIPYGLNDPSPNSLMSNRLSRYLIGLERSAVQSLAPRLPVLELEVGRRHLLALGFGSVLVHLDAYPDAHARKVVALLTLACGPPAMFGNIARFSLDEPGETLGG